MLEEESNSLLDQVLEEMSTKAEDEEQEALENKSSEGEELKKGTVNVMEEDAGGAVTLKPQQHHHTEDGPLLSMANQSSSVSPPKITVSSDGIQQQNVQALEEEQNKNKVKVQLTRIAELIECSLLKILQCKKTHSIHAFFEAFFWISFELYTE